MAEREGAGRGERRSRTRKLALGMVLAALSLGVGGVLLLAAADGTATPPEGAAAASGGAPAIGETVRPVPTAVPVPPPTRTPTPPPERSSEPSAAPTGQPSAQVAAAGGSVGVSPQMLSLRDELAGEIAAYRQQVGGIEVAVAVTDLQTGETISVGGNDLHKTGCTINMFALFAAVGEFEAGRADPQSVAYNIRVGIGGSYPPQVKQFLQTLFGTHQLGVERAREMMSSWGMEASLFDHVPYYGDGTQKNLLTALESNAVLTKLYRGELFEPEWTAYTLARLREISPGLNYILPGQLPSAATVAHKIGYYWDLDGWVDNDVGIVTFSGGDGREKAYAITYLSQKARTEYTGYSFGARLSRIVWDWFEAKYRLGTEPPPPSPPPPPPPTPEPTPEPSPTPSPTSEPTPSPSPTSEPTPSPSPTPRATPTPSPTPSPTPEPTPVPTPSPVPSPTPTATPEPTPAP